MTCLSTVKYGDLNMDVFFMLCLLGITPTCKFDDTTKEALSAFLIKHDIDINSSKLKYLETSGGPTLFTNKKKLDGSICDATTWEYLYAFNPIKSSSIDDILEIADDLGVSLPAVLAVKKVESGGKSPFTKRGRPLILFEGHIFYKELKERGLNPESIIILDASAIDIIYPKWTKEFYLGNDAEYTRLNRALKINVEAALRSASVGMFLIMGFNYKLCKSDNLIDYWRLSFLGETNLIKFFGLFIKSNSMINSLKTLDWASFALKYNGPKYAENKYDILLAEAYSSYSGSNKA